MRALTVGMCGAMICGSTYVHSVCYSLGVGTANSAIVQQGIPATEVLLHN
jgi:hypothetical protein